MERQDIMQVGVKGAWEHKRRKNRGKNKRKYISVNKPH
jgi:hypothetical protein